MTKRKSKTTEFRPPKRAQPRAKRQRSTEETILQSADETQIQTPQSENNNSHNASCSDKLDEHQPGQSTLQKGQKTEFPVDPSCSLEEKTCNGDSDEDGNDTNPPEVSHEIEQTAEIAVQTPEPNNSDKYALSRHLNVEATNEDPPDVDLEDEESEIASNSNHESQKVPDDSELPSDECQDSIDTEPKMAERLGSSDIIAETSVDETVIQMTEDAGSADPIVKRKIRKRMGMCRLGERKRMLKGQPTRGNVFGGGQENEAGQGINEESVMMSDDLKKDGSVSLEDEGTTESEVSASPFPTPCPLEGIPVQEELPDVQYGNDVQVQILVEGMSSDQEITHETDNTILSHADDTLVETETECVEQSSNESNIREDKPEMCDDFTTEMGTEVTVDLAEVCKESADVLAQDAVVIEGPLEVLKETAEASASTSEVANHFEELLVVGGNEMEFEECCPSERDMNTYISNHTNEHCAESMDIAANETISALPVINQIEDKCESLDCTLVAAAVTPEKNTVNCEDSCIWSLSLPAAPPCGEDYEVQSVTEHDGLLSDAHEPHPSPVAEPDPSSPLSIDSVTDSQLNNIPLSLEDLPISEAACDLEDATEMVCGLIRDLASLNQIVRDAHRKIGVLQQGRKPPRPQFRCMYGPPH
ncbi:uncharacterized protein si:ch211-286b5.2 isoform X2 [Ctenopharyngodon idella]|uniref:uncharacterized protein si:ch211-286b5.2 isoform X2 n=1 Tax=Ctenopharyngodon idella TaxID=7959 RepID=UPI00222E1FEE|nr:uncharacterized protein si:ch211-286b5.2 isoform X2 [Ctenopharyngodon idella]